MRKDRGSRWELIVLCCTLAVPTVGQLMGIYGEELSLAAMGPAVMVGLLLGMAHVALRPVLRLLFAPVGCLTLGLFGLVIDVALIYLCAAFIEDFRVPSLLYAVLTALLINAVCAMAAGRR